MSDEDHGYILWMANHIERELLDAFYDRNVNGDDSYLKELDERYKAGYLDTDLLGENPEWDEPMGGDLPAAKGKAPTFIVWAVKDPDDANLDRVQIIKGWTKHGQIFEKIYDVVWSGGARA